MKIEILMSCMHQRDDSLVRKSGLTGWVLAVSQGDIEAYREYSTDSGSARFYFTTQRGLTKSRNMAIAHSDADVCMLCDDDETFVSDYEQRIRQAYQALPQADVIIFKMVNRPPSFRNKVQRLRFPKTLKVSSWQISFRRQKLVESGVAFDEHLGAGTGNGGEEELKFLTDCQRAGLKIYYCPVAVASVAQTESTWFDGFTEQFFYNRGATTRYILGAPVAVAYAVYYVIRKYPKYQSYVTRRTAMRAILRGIRENRIGKALNNS